MVTYGPYKAHDPVKNWIVGAGAIIALVLATVLVAVLTVSSVRSTIASFSALPSSGSSTAAWYWQGVNGATHQAQPLDVDVDHGFSTIVTSDQDVQPYFVGLDRHGDAYVWGRSPGYKLSLAAGDTPAEVTMPADTHFTKIATNNGYVLAIDQAGRLWSWGDDSSFIIGTVNSIPPALQEPVEIATPAGVRFKAISVGFDFALAIDASGRIWAWGASNEGNLGIGTNAVGLPAPTEVATPPGVTFTAVSAGIYESVALDSNGRAWAWGDANGGDLGVNVSSVPTGPGTCEGTFGGFCSDTPLEVNIPPGVTLTAVAAGSGYVAALDSTGRIWTWGSSNQGALGLGAAVSTCPTTCLSQAGQPELPENSTPAAVASPAGVRFTSVAVTEGQSFNYQNTVAVDSNGALWAWGSNAFLEVTKNTSPCSPSLATFNLDTGVCVVKPTQLPGPAGVRFKGAVATNFAVLGYTR